MSDRIPMPKRFGTNGPATGRIPEIDDVVAIREDEPYQADIDER